MHEHKPESAGYDRRHILIMLLGCLIPIVLIIVVISTNIDSTYIPFLLILLCPLLMLLMHLPRRVAKKRS